MNQPKWYLLSKNQSYNCDSGVILDCMIDADNRSWWEYINNFYFWNGITWLQSKIKIVLYLPRLLF